MSLQTTMDEIRNGLEEQRFHKNERTGDCVRNRVPSDRCGVIDFDRDEQMVCKKHQLMFLFVSIVTLTSMSGCGGSDDAREGAETSKPDPGPYVSVEKFIGDDEEIANRPAEEGWFQVRVKAKPRPVEQDLIVRTRLLFTENEALGKAPNAQITADEMASLRELRAESLDIRNLTGLEHATQLQRLHLNNNLISALSPLAALTRLGHLELDENVISDLSPLAGLIHIGHLGLAHNLITDLSPLAGLTNLRGITLHHNAISDLSPFAGLIRLEWIGMSHNLLADLTPLSGL